MNSTLLHPASKSEALEFICEEPGGIVTHRVWQMSLSLENLRRFWNEARKHRTLFGEEIVDDFSKFINRLVVDGPEGIVSTGLFWVIDDFVGVLYLTEIDPGVDALAHYTFFNGRHRGRTQMTKDLLRYVFDKYGFVRLTVHLPLYASPVAFKFVESLGFQHEGRKRKATLYKGCWFDVNIFGLLREEAS